MKTTIGDKYDEPVAPQVPRRFRDRRPAAGWRSVCRCPSGSMPARAAPKPRALAAGGPEVNAWVVIKPDDRCVIRIARSEMGQGTMTGLAQLVVEELECDWNEGVDGVSDPRREPRAEARLGRDGHRRQPRHPHLPGLRPSRRRRGADDAAAGGGRPVAGSRRRTRRSPNGVITHAASKRTTSYGKVAAAAAKLPAPDPASIKLKDPKDWKIAGKPMKRLDTADKLDGTPRLRDRRQAAGDAVRGHQGLPGVRRQARELRRIQDRRPARIPARGQGERLDRRRRRRYVVAREIRARRVADRLGRRPRARRNRARRSRRTSRKA